MVLNERTEKGKRKKAPGIATFKRMSTYKWWWTEMEPSRWGSARRPWWPGSSPTPWSCCRWCRWRRWRRRTRQRTKTVWGPWDQYFKTFFVITPATLPNLRQEFNARFTPDESALLLLCSVTRWLNHEVKARICPSGKVLCLWKYKTIETVYQGQ